MNALCVLTPQIQQFCKHTHLFRSVPSDINQSFNTVHLWSWRAKRSFKIAIWLENISNVGQGPTSRGEPYKLYKESFNLSVKYMHISEWCSTCIFSCSVFPVKVKIQLWMYICKLGQNMDPDSIYVGILCTQKCISQYNIHLNFC